MLYIFHGPDHFSAREALRELARELDTDGNLASQTVRLEGAGLTPAALMAATHTGSFFAENRLVVVEGLLARLGGAGRGRRRRNARQQDNGAASASDLDQFIEVFAQTPSTTTIVLLEESAPPAALNALKDVGHIRAFPFLGRDHLREWARRRVLDRGGKISGPALTRLCEVIDSTNIATLASEIDKLIAYANGRAIEVADIEEMVSGAMNYMPWDVTDAVIGGRADRAIGVLQRMVQKDHPPQVMFFMLVRAYRQILLAQSMLREGKSAPEIGRALGITYPFALDKVIGQAARYPAARLEAAYRRLLEMDVAVKTGVLEIELALEMLITELAQDTGGRPAAQAARRSPYSVSV